MSSKVPTKKEPKKSKAQEKTEQPKVKAKINTVQEPQPEKGTPELGVTSPLFQD